MQRLFLTDLDHTLFNTELYYHHVRHVIENQYGIPADELHDELREMTKHVGPYNVFAHARERGVDTDELKKALKQELRDNDYFFPDVKPYLKKRAEHSSDDVMIITVGELESQLFKIELVDELSEYSALITKESKAELIGRSFTWQDEKVKLTENDTEYDEIILIDDRAETFENLEHTPNLLPLRLRRLYETHSEEPTPSNIQEIHTLADIENVISAKN